jgi:ATP-dependent Zn protease
MEAWWKLFVSWMPFIILLAFWFYFLRKVRPSRYGELVDRTFVHMERVEKLLEQIAVSLEKTRA